MSNRDSAEVAAVGRRPTPLDPCPEPRPPEARSEQESRPSELGADAVAILDDRTFMFSDAFGDVRAGSTSGLVHEDTRFLSQWELGLGGGRLSLLKSSTVDYDTASFFLTNPICRGCRQTSWRSGGCGLSETAPSKTLRSSTQRWCRSASS